MDGDGYIPANKVHILADAVNEQCDALDGIKDGVVERSTPLQPQCPRHCFCKGSDTSQCFTAAQVAAVQKIWAGLRTTDGQVIYPGLRPRRSRSRMVGQLYHRQRAVQGPPYQSGLPFFKFMVFDDANWDYKTFKFDASRRFR